MSVLTFRALRRRSLCGSAIAAALGFANAAAAQTQLPEVVVTAPKEKEKPKPKPVQVRAAPRPAAAPAPAAPAAPPVNPVAATTNTLNQGLNTIYAPIGTIPNTISHDTIQALPGGDNQTVEKILLQAPGVTQDSAASGNFHVRNEHANVQVRINGIMLPDGVTGFGTFLDTALIGNISLITGALPAQFGLRTSGVLDIQTRNDAFNGGTVGVYGGTRQTFTPSFEYGGQVGQTQYFLTGRFFESNIGLENPTPNWAAIHDHTTQERGFAYVSTILDPYSRFTLMAGASYGAFQIPNTPGLTPNFTAFGISNFNSALLNENQFEQSYFMVAAWQRSINGADVQLSYFNRYSSVHFIPDPIGDIIFNGVASEVFRSDFANGVTGDIAYRLNEAHTLRAGLLLRTDKTQVTNTDTLEPLDAAGNPIDAPFTVVDPSSLVGYTVGLYLQDEWRLTNSLTLNAGIRFDQYWAIYHRISVQPAHQPHLEAVREHHLPHRVRPHLHAARAGARRADQSGFVPEHDGAAERELGQSGAGGARGRLRRRRRAASASRIGSQRRCLLQESEESHRRRPVRTGLRAHCVQLCPRRECRCRACYQIQERPVPGLRQYCGGAADRDQSDLEPIPVRQYDAAPRLSADSPSFSTCKRIGSLPITING